MASPVISPAYRQIEEWYQRWDAYEQAKPIQPLVTTGAPDESLDQANDPPSGSSALDITA